MRQWLEKQVSLVSVREVAFVTYARCCEGFDRQRFTRGYAAGTHFQAVGVQIRAPDVIPRERARTSI